MFGKWLKSVTESTPPPGAEELVHVVRRELPDADQESAVVITAIVGLLGAVAHADRDFSDAEEQRIRAELARINGMTEKGIDATCIALRRHLVEVSTVQMPRYARVLVELGDHELRLQVLEMLVDLAAADGSISHAETNLLRNVTRALGLTQVDYNRAQAQHRDRLAVLQRQ